jgi:uncharacterized protein (UPF0297 family)
MNVAFNLDYQNVMSTTSIAVGIEKEIVTMRMNVREDCEKEDIDFIMTALYSFVNSKTLPSIERIIGIDECISILKERGYNNDITLNESDIRDIDKAIEESKATSAFLKGLFKKKNNMDI